MAVEDDDPRQVLLDLEAGSFHVADYTTRESEIVDYFAEIAADELATQFELALKVGVLALRAAGTTERIDYIEKRFGALRAAFEERMREVFGEEGSVARLVERYFGEKGEVPEFIEDMFGPEGAILQDLFDPSQKGTPLANLKEEILEGFVKLRKDLGVQEREAELEAATPLKGYKFEDLCEDLLGEIARPFGDEMERTTEKTGLIQGSKKGDFVITLANRPDLRIAIETKDTGHQSLNRIRETMEETMENRDARYGLFVVRRVETLAKSVGWFNEYHGRFLVVALGTAATEEHVYREMMETAVRWARTRLLVREARLREGIDASAIRRELELAEAVLGRFQRIRTQGTNAMKAIQAIKRETDGIQAQLVEALGHIEREIASALEGE